MLQSNSEPSTAFSAPTPMPAVQSLRGDDVSMTDWDALFDAVKERLRLVAHPATAGDSAAQALAQRDVLECVAALDQLHITLRHEFGRSQRIERELRAAHAAAAASRVAAPIARPVGRSSPRSDIETGVRLLPNGRFFRDRLGQALAQAAPQLPDLVVLFLELDGLDADDPPRLGRENFEQLLRILAARVTRALRDSDTVSRMGDAQFACLVCGAWSRDSLSQLACRLFDALSTPVTVNLGEHALRPSIGIAICPSDGSTHDGLIQSASAAMYRAKGGQLGYAFFDQKAPG
jgi:diguanylate cyclase (GGDEF)-like protein